MILLRARVPIAVAIEELLLIWAASDSEEWINRVAWIPSSVATTVALVAPCHVVAQGEGLVQTARKTAAASTITVQKLRTNVSVLMGAGGNIALLPGRDGKFLIDAGFAGAGPKISNALASLSSDPIRHLINTRWHFDHTDSNEWLHSAGAAILAHANTRKHLSTTTRVVGWISTIGSVHSRSLRIEEITPDEARRELLNDRASARREYAA